MIAVKDWVTVKGLSQSPGTSVALSASAFRCLPHQDGRSSLGVSIPATQVSSAPKVFPASSAWRISKDIGPGICQLGSGTEYHRLGGLETTDIDSLVLEARKSKIKCWQIQCLVRAHFRLRKRTSSGCVPVCQGLGSSLL